MCTSTLLRSAQARLFRAAGRDFRRCLVNLLLFDLLLSMVAFAGLTPLATWLLRQSIAWSGQAAIGNLDLARFLLTPPGLASAVIAVVLFATISLTRWAGLMYIGYGAAEHRRLRYTDALRFALRRAPRIAALSFLVLVVAALIATPGFALATVVARTLLDEHDINYYLAVRPGEFWTALGLGIALAAISAAALLVAALHLALALPNVLFRDTTTLRAFVESRRLTRGRILQIALVLASWLAGWTLFSFLLNLGLHGVGWLLVDLTGQRVGWLVAVLGSMASLSLLLNYVLTFVGQAVGCLLVVRIYRDACRSEGLEPLALEERHALLPEQPQRALPAKAPLGVALAAAVLAAVISVQLLEGLHLSDQVDISAHRGSSLSSTENSLTAFRQAIADGANYLELDVQRTADGVLVVVHDADLMRVANRPLVVSEANYAELSKIKLARRGQTGRSLEKIATLDQVIDVAEGKAKLLVELKSYRGDSRRLARDVVRALRTRQLSSQSVVMSQKYEELLRVQRLDPSLKTAFVTSASVGNLTNLDVDALAVSRNRATDVLIASAHARGQQVYVWTVDDPREISRLIDRGVDNIITNDPAAVVRVLAQRAKLSNAERLLLRFRHVYEW